MCSSKTKLQVSSTVDHDMTPTAASHINGRPVLQPNCNRAATTTTTKTTILDSRNSLKKPSKLPLQPLLSPPKTTTFTTKTKPSAFTPPPSPNLKSPRPPAVNRGNDPNLFTSSSDKVFTTKKEATTTSSLENKSKPCVQMEHSTSLKYPSSLILEAPGSIAAARREQVAIMQVQRKMRIAHYGRTKSANYQRNQPSPAAAAAAISITREEKRCNFITSNSDPIYVAYHDEEWGVPVHDDKMLFELLVLTGAQVGSDWTSVLKKRQDFRDAFSDFDAEIVSKYTEKKITSITAYYGIQVSLVRGVVDNSNRILEINKEYGSFDKYLWGFVNHKPIGTQYKSCHKIPVKTSKSESISKDMVRRGFRLVGPTVIHSFMQAAGLTNDHLMACSRHLQCVELASHPAMPCSCVV